MFDASGDADVDRESITLPAVEGPSPYVERKLAAILAADVVGSSRLMESDEENAIQTLHAYRSVAYGLVESHHGRVFGGAGDSIVAEFPSAVSAVRCAMDIQQEIERRNRDGPEGRDMLFRIGINLGDVVVDDDNLLGDGVNVAARLEALAPAGGFCISQSIHEQIRGKIEIPFEDAGEHQVRNITRPIRVWRWSGSPTPSTNRPDEPSPKSDTPSVVVLPFVNMSGDTEQEYFSDGISEDLITDLSKISGLFVPARNSSFMYKGQTVKPEKVASELGVGHILEGSVRKSGGRVRITAQLIDARTGGHLWADRYDRDLTDVFAVQDEITHRIVESLRVTLLPQEKEAIERVPTESMEAYKSYLLGRQFFRRHSRANYQVAKRMFQTAIQQDSNYARAWAGVADCDSFLYLAYYRTEGLDNILEASAKALELDADLAEAHASRGLALSTVDRLDEAEAEFKTAIDLDPNLYEAHYFYARACFAQGRMEEAAEHFKRAAENMPNDFEAPIFLMELYNSQGRREDAMATGKRGFENAEQELAVRPENVRAAYLGASYLAQVGEEERAREWIDRALAIEPDDFLTQYNAACTLANLGDIDQAIDLLENALPQAHSEIRGWVKHDTDLDPLRDSPRFRALLESMGG
jgi:adenylate cyclase